MAREIYTHIYKHNNNYCQMLRIHEIHKYVCVFGVWTTVRSDTLKNMINNIYVSIAITINKPT